jgi:two-component system chemotaxis response regulator CheY
MLKKVLIVDDSNYTQSVIKKALQGHASYEVVGVANDGASALKMAQKLRPDIITLDNILPDMIGMNMIRTLKSDNPSLRVVMVSAIQQQSIIDQAMSLGADSYLVKPITKENLLMALEESQV